MSLTNNILKLIVQHLGNNQSYSCQNLFKENENKKELAIRHDDKLDALTNKLFALLPYKMA